MAESKNTKTTDVATVEPTNVGVVPDFASGYSSIKGTDFATRKEILKAVNNSVSVRDHIGEVLSVKDIVTMPVEFTDEETGAVSEDTRTVFVLADDSTVHATGKGIQNSLRNIFMIAGEPSDWDGPLDITIAEVRAPKGTYYRINIV